MIDASKVPPSRFQKREGSIFSTSSSRDSHITRRDRDASYHAKLKEKVCAVHPLKSFPFLLNPFTVLSSEIKFPVDIYRIMLTASSSSSSS